jgi:hypothetical protein
MDDSFRLLPSPPSIFEALLEACSRSCQPDEDESSLALPPPSEKMEETAGRAWFLMEEAPFETLL